MESKYPYLAGSGRVHRGVLTAAHHIPLRFDLPGINLRPGSVGAGLLALRSCPNGVSPLPPRSLESLSWSGFRPQNLDVKELRY